jgi:hypothetical protein
MTLRRGSALWYAQGKDAGSARSSATGATEDDAWRRPVRSRGRGFVLQQPAWEADSSTASAANLRVAA